MEKTHPIKIIILVTLQCFLSTIEPYAQNVGIGTVTPEAKLDISHLVQDSFIISEDFEAAGVLPIPFTTGGDEPWEVDAINGSIGLASARSGYITDTQNSYMELQVLIPDKRTAVLRFKAKTESEDGGDYLKFELDGVQVFTYSGDYDWYQRTYLLEQGTHNLKWSYTKNGEIDYMDDFAAIDSVRINYVEKFALRVDDGTQARGKLLVSDAYGNASWEKLSNTSIDDTDEDTGIYTEYSKDDDVIRFKLKNLFSFTMSGNSTTANLTTAASNLFVGGLSSPLLTGNNNTVLGSASGISIADGYSNTFLGYSSGRLNISGIHNLCAGAYAGRANLASKNVFLGSFSGYKNTIGFHNVFIGFESAKENIEGSENTFIGSFSGKNNLTGNQNVFVGFDAGNNSDGSKNTFIGYAAGKENQLGGDNTFIGHRSGHNNLSGDENTFLGFNSGVTNTLGNKNLYLGNWSGWRNTDGSENTFVGYEAGSDNETGDQNTFVGFKAGRTAKTISGLTFVGFNAGANNDSGTYNTFVGYRAGQTTTSGDANAFFGSYAGWANSNGSNNSFFGYNSGAGNQTGKRNTIMGSLAGHQNNGHDNTMVGYEAGRSTNYSTENTFVGSSAGRTTTLGNAGSFFGYTAGYSNSSGVKNTFLGHQSGFYNSIGNENTFIGHNAGLTNSQGNKNTFVGNKSGELNSTGFENTFIGHRASENNTTGSYNTSIGYNINQGVNSSYNTHIGYEAVNISGNSYSNASAFGYAAIVDASNRITLGNTVVSQIGGYSGWSNLSDGRMKKNVSEDRVPGLDFIRQLHPVSYTIDYNLLADALGEDKKQSDGERVSAPADPFFIKSRDERSKVRQTGFIAQEVDLLIKKLGVDFDAVNVPAEQEGLYSLKYAEFVVPLVKAVQELSQSNDSLRISLEENLVKMNKLTQQVADLQLQLASYVSTKSATVETLRQPE